MSAPVQPHGAARPYLVLMHGETDTAPATVPPHAEQVPDWFTYPAGLPHGVHFSTRNGLRYYYAIGLDGQLVAGPWCADAEVIAECADALDAHDARTFAMCRLQVVRGGVQ